MASEDDNSDEWAVDELPDFQLPSKRNNVKASGGKDVEAADEDEGWASKLPTKDAADVPSTTITKEASSADKGNPMLLIDMTSLSSTDPNLPDIHCKFDRNAVNDPEAVRCLRRTIEAQYNSYSKYTDWLADGTVVPCGSSVWRPAVERLRRERPGHYICPIFPPKQAS